MKPRTLLIIAGSAVIVGAAIWGGVRWWDAQRERPMRTAIAALKAGDYAKSLPILRRFARAGNSTAGRMLGEVYARGVGTEADPIQASIWFRRAECGCVTTGESEYAIARWYLDGYGGPGKHQETLNWFQRAAEAGHRMAQQMLAAPEPLSAKGVLVPDDVSAYWRRVIHEL